MMNKQQAADFLQVTPRAIEGYVAKGRLTVTYARGRRGNIALFKEEELQRIKEERQQVNYTNPFAALVPQQQQAIVPQQPAPISTFSQVLAMPEVQEALTKLITNAIIKGVEYWVASNTADKLALTLKEASNLSGLSVSTLRADIHAGNLRAKIIGRGWKIRRTDLDNYIKKIWK